MNEDRKNEWLINRKKFKASLSAKNLFEKLILGDKTALSTSITLLESALVSDQEKAKELLDLCLPFSGKSFRIGITGIPGVGKSSFIEEFGKIVCEKGHKLAVLAIDPSSEKTGGSILGDKTRMQDLSVREDVFIRPSAAGSTLGGVARKTRETILLCEAAGFDSILIETVGVGQSEIMVHSMVDFFLLLLLTGAGDELQGIKRGIMEMADGLVVTKADGENKKRAQLTIREIKNAIHLFPPTENGWIPEVKACSSLLKEGLDEVLEMILRFETHAKINGSFENKRNSQEQYWMHETFKELLVRGLMNSNGIANQIKSMETKVKNREISSFEAAQLIYDEYLANIKKNGTN